MADGIVGGGDARVRRTRGKPVQRGNLAQAQDTARADSDGTIMTAAERRRMIREEWSQTALPKPPELPGFHVCWLTTSSGVDTVHRRIKLGYTLVRVDEYSDFEADNKPASSNPYGGEYVTCNEMVLGKIPIEKYQDAMAEFHHFAPQEEERAIRARMKQKTEEINSEAGVQAIKTVGGGFDTLGVADEAGPPVFGG